MGENPGPKHDRPLETTPSELSWALHPKKELLRLALPMVGSLLLTTLVNAFDTWIVGAKGARELAAAGLGNTVAFTVSSFSLALFAAAKVKVGEAIGRGDLDSLAGTRRAYLKLAALLGLVSVTLGLFGAEALPFVSRDETMGALSRDYLRIRVLSVVPMILSAALAHHRQAEGAPRLPMQATLFASLVHVPLSFSLLRTDLGIFGVATAYVASRAVELLVLVVGLRAELVVRPRSEPALSSIFRLGLTTGIERILDMAAFAMVPLILARKDPVSVAAHQVTLQLSQLSFLPLVALSEAVSILVSQIEGAHAKGLGSRIAVWGYVWTFGYASVLALLFATLPESLVSLFSQDPAVIAAGTASLRMAAILQLINSSYAVTKGILRGFSRFDLVAWVAVAAAWGVTPPLTYFLGVNRGLGAQGAWLSLVIEVTLGVAILVPVARNLLRSR